MIFAVCAGAGSTSFATVPITPQGAALGAFFDSMEVDYYWPNGFQVNWLTGSTNAWTGGGTTDILPNVETDGDTTHCSAFTAGATEWLGVYTIRPPQQVIHNLANVTYSWLFTNNAGWIYITDVNTNAVMQDAQNLANQGNFVMAVYQSVSGSGHIAFIRPNNTRTDADITAHGPQDCQAGTYNYNSTNIQTGFNEHPTAFPNAIRYFYHPITNTIITANPVILSAGTTNGMAACTISSVEGRSYFVKWSTNGVTWKTGLSYTNPNNQPLTMCVTNVAFPKPVMGGYELMVTSPYRDASQVAAVDICVVGVTLNGAANVSLPVGSSFTDPGITTSDTCANALTITTNGSVNTSAIGTYTLTYTASDASGNSATATRTVAVTGLFHQLLTLAPGETATPGVSPGKTGTPIPQWVGEGYPIMVEAVDTNWTLVGSATDNVTVASSAVSDNFPGSAMLAGGTATVLVTNNSSGSVTLTATDAADGTKLSASSMVNVSLKNPTTTTLACSPNPACAGQPVTFTATISGSAGPTGTVMFQSGSNVLGTAVLAGNLAVYTASGGAGIFPVVAVYSGDHTNDGSVSTPVSLTITTNSIVVSPAQMRDGQDYAAATSTPITGRPPWLIGSAGGSGSTSFIKILAGDLTGTTTPALMPLPNQANPAAHLQVATPGTTGRWYYRSLGNPVTNGAAYFSFLLDVVTNSTTTDEYRMTLIANGASNSPAASDPLSLHVRQADSTHYNLGIERLNGVTVWAADALATNTDYLVAVKYAFGNTGSCKLFINPVPGQGEPAGDAVALSDGLTAEPTNIGTVLFFESAVAPVTSGAINCDVMRADTNWYNVTPSATGTTTGAAMLALSPGPQTFVAEDSSSLMTVTLEDQNGNPINAWSDTVVNLVSTSPDSNFQDGSSLALVSSVTIPAGSSSASFYYLDPDAGLPVIMAASGLLLPATQTETVLANGVSTLPFLTISQMGTNVLLSWPIADGGFGLESSVSFSNWNNASGGLSTNNGIVSEIVPAVGNCGFFRLYHP